jgi:hypothetical protein
MDLSKKQVPTGKVLACGSSLEGVSFRDSGTIQICGNGDNLPSTRLSRLVQAKALNRLQMSREDEISEAEVGEFFKELDRVLTEADVAWVKTYA